jgi:hypothetical protein
MDERRRAIGVHQCRVCGSWMAAPDGRPAESRVDGHPVPASSSAAQSSYPQGYVDALREEWLRAGHDASGPRWHWRGEEQERSGDETEAEETEADERGAEERLVGHPTPGSAAAESAAEGSYEAGWIDGYVEAGRWYATGEDADEMRGEAEDLYQAYRQEERERRAARRQQRRERAER